MITILKCEVIEMCARHSFNSAYVNYAFLLHHTGCYAQRFGPRGIGHSGMSSLGLMCDIKDIEWQRYCT